MIGDEIRVGPARVLMELARRLDNNLT